MAVTYDPAKRERTLRERGLDFEQAEQVFAGLTLDIQTCAATTASCRSIQWITSRVGW
jgi:uncharacterized DUF497 family protein